MQRPAKGRPSCTLFWLATCEAFIRIFGLLPGPAHRHMLGHTFPWLRGSPPIRLLAGQHCGRLQRRRCRGQYLSASHASLLPGPLSLNASGA